MWIARRAAARAKQKLVTGDDCADGIGGGEVETNVEPIEFQPRTARRSRILACASACEDCRLNDLGRRESIYPHETARSGRTLNSLVTLGSRRANRARGCELVIADDVDQQVDRAGQVVQRQSAIGR